ncbi:RHS repeat domain-containing protein [Thermodesulfobacteriota bacterium]
MPGITEPGKKAPEDSITCARYYDARTGRFISRDPAWPGLGRISEINPYAYAAQNPVSLINITGREWPPPSFFYDYSEWMSNNLGFSYDDPTTATGSIESEIEAFDPANIPVLDKAKSPAWKKQKARLIKGLAERVKSAISTEEYFGTGRCPTSAYNEKLLALLASGDPDALKHAREHLSHEQYDWFKNKAPGVIIKKIPLIGDAIGIGETIKDAGEKALGDK